MNNFRVSGCGRGINCHELMSVMMVRQGGGCHRRDHFDHRRVGFVVTTIITTGKTTVAISKLGWWGDRRGHHHHRGVVVNGHVVEVLVRFVRRNYNAHCTSNVLIEPVVLVFDKVIEKTWPSFRVIVRAEIIIHSLDKVEKLQKFKVIFIYQLK